MSSFLEKIIKAENGMFRLVTAQENGNAAWFYIELHPHMYAEYKRVLKNGMLHTVSNYGKILQSGWGEAPKEIKSMLSS
jgi:hypothetical protein